MSKVKLGSVTDSCLGKMLDAAKNKGRYAPYLANINVRWGAFDTSNLSQMRFEDDEQDRYGLIAGDLIMCEGGEPGRCAIWQGEVPNMKIQKALHRIRPHDCLDIRFLYYWFLLAGKSGWLNRYFTETTIKHLPGESLKDVEIDLPSLPSQNGIADVLSSIDDRIALNKRINAELEAMTKTLYDYWFVQFDFPDENGKPYRTSGGAMEWNEQLKREIPKGWDAIRIGDLLAQIQNTERIQTTGYLPEGSIPIIDQSSDYIAGYTNSEASRIHTKKGAIVFGDHTRIVKFVCFDFARGADGTQVILSNNSCMPNVLLYHAILKIDLSSYGYARHYKFLKDASVIVPIKDVAESFENTVVPLYNQITHNVFENIELTRLRDWLLPMLMNGQATVVDADKTDVIHDVEKPMTDDEKFSYWLQNQGIAARGELDPKTLREIYDAMDDDDK